VLAAVLATVNENYPESAPWCILEKDSADQKSGHNTPLQLAIYNGTGRQPLHFDNGLSWYTNEAGKKWSALSLVLSCNDGYGTYIHGPPVAGIFDFLYRSSPELGAKAVDQILKTYENKFDFALTKTNRAGQLIGFHPGEQVHCGVGANKYQCTLTKYDGRIVLYMQAVPQKFHARVCNLELFSAEEPWGLVHLTMEQKRQQVRGLVFSPRTIGSAGEFVE